MITGFVLKFLVDRKPKILKVQSVFEKIILFDPHNCGDYKQLDSISINVYLNIQWSGIAHVPCVQRISKPLVLEKCLAAYIWRGKSVVRLSGPYPEGRWFESNSRNHYLI